MSNEPQFPAGIEPSAEQAGLLFMCRKRHLEEILSMLRSCIARLAKCSFLCLVTLALLGVSTVGTFSLETRVSPGPLPILLLLLILSSCFLLMRVNSRNRREGASARRA